MLLLLVNVLLLLFCVCGYGYVSYCTNVMIKAKCCVCETSGSVEHRVTATIYLHSVLMRLPVLWVGLSLV